jgi:hypothetical protein
MIYGQSGTGKSTSLRNFNPDDVALINVSGKPLPFKSAFKSLKTDSYEKIAAALHSVSQKIIVIDDATYLMANEFMRTVSQKGYEKFNSMALNFFTLIRACSALPDDVTVYFLGHSEIGDNGNEKFKTIGKMLDDKITLEGLFTVVLKTVVQDGKYYFSTQNNGQDTVKSPIGMFDEPLIDNDLAAVDKAIREYWAMPIIKTKDKKENAK